MQFDDRVDAGKKLAKSMTIQNPSNTIVLALPRGGVPLGIILAQEHSVDFDVILAKKIGHPLHSEYAIGAVAEGGEPFFDQVEKSQVDSDWIRKEVTHVRKEMERRRTLYDQVLKQQPLQSKDVILVDDGIATGRTMFAAIEAAKKANPRRLTVAVPIIPKDTFTQLQKQVDEVVALDVPARFLGAVGAYYRVFPQLEDKEIQERLRSFGSDQKSLKPD